MTANRTAFTPEEQKAFEPAEKIGIVASVNPEGRPHVFPDYFHHGPPA